MTLLIAAALALAAPEMIPQTQLDPLGRTAPGFRAPTFDGGEFVLEDVRGTPVVLSFWASWCGPCRHELPALSELQKQRDDVAVYAINVDRERGRAEQFLRQVKVELPIVWDNESAAMGAYNVLSMPTLFLIDAQGTVKFSKTGFSQDKGLAELVQALDELK